MSSALRTARGILNFRYGGGQSLEPPTNLEDPNRSAYEWRTEIGPDESCSIWLRHDDQYSVKSPNGRAWLSVAPNGDLEERPTDDPGQPGPWEAFSYDPDQQALRSLNHLTTIFVIVGDQPSGGGGIGPEHGFIHVDGYSLKDEDGEHWPFLAYAMHTLISNVAKGEDIRPLLDDAVRLGYNTILTIGAHLSPWKIENGFYCDPRDPEHTDRMHRLFDACADRGLRCFYHALADCQYALSQSDQTRCWEQAQHAARGRWNVFLSIGNESGANGWDPSKFARPHDLGGVLACTGSAGIDTPPYQGYWDFILWEGRRDLHQKYKAMDDAGAGVLELLAGYEDPRQGKVGPFHCPVLQAEPPFFHDTSPDMYGDTRWTDPRDALMLGVNITANCPGGVFGASNPLICQPIGDGVAAECAKQFLRGLKAGFVR